MPLRRHDPTRPSQAKSHLTWSEAKSSPPKKHKNTGRGAAPRSPVWTGRSPAPGEQQHAPPPIPEDEVDEVEEVEEVGRGGAPPVEEAHSFGRGGAPPSLDLAGGQVAPPGAQPRPRPADKKFVNALSIGTSNFAGLLRPTNLDGVLNTPYRHQMRAVRKIASRFTQFFVLNHAPGLGKTATALMAYAAECAMHERKCKVVISVPASCLDQWYASVLDWLNVHRSEVIVTNKLAQLTPEAMRDASVLILSKDLVANAFSSCFSYYTQHHTTVSPPHGPKWRAAWDRTNYQSGNPSPLHCLFSPPRDSAVGWHGGFDLLIVDEAHILRNPRSRVCEAHAELSRVCTKRVMLTGTIVVNRPSDLAGLCKGGNCPSQRHLPPVGPANPGLDEAPPVAPTPDRPINFTDVRSYSAEGTRGSTTVNRKTIYELRKRHVNRCEETVLSLPPLVRECVNFDVNLSASERVLYNSSVHEARTLKRRVELQDGGKASASDLHKLMSTIQHLQQLIVHPLLALHSAAGFKTNPRLIDESANRPTGAMLALRDELRLLSRAGHKKIIVAATHTTSMKIVKRWLELSRPSGSAGSAGSDEGEFGALYLVSSCQPTTHTKHASHFLPLPRKSTFLPVLHPCVSRILGSTTWLLPVAPLQAAIALFSRLGDSGDDDSEPMAYESLPLASPPPSVANEDVESEISDAEAIRNALRSTSQSAGGLSFAFGGACVKSSAANGETLE